MTQKYWFLNLSVARKSSTTSGLSVSTTYWHIVCSRATSLLSANSGARSPDHALKYWMSGRIRLTSARSVPKIPRTSSTRSWSTSSTSGRTAPSDSNASRRPRSRSTTATPPNLSSG
ncbi:MAG: hypothetical protein M3N33_03510 [Actinomycetota bacterium]|nr:hypothetical protein [Actinomycetota bacterium]